MSFRKVSEPVPTVKYCKGYQRHKTYCIDNKLEIHVHLTHFVSRLKGMEMRVIRHERKGVKIGNTCTFDLLYLKVEENGNTSFKA